MGFTPKPPPKMHRTVATCGKRPATELHGVSHYQGPVDGSVALPQVEPFQPRPQTIHVTLIPSGRLLLRS